MHFCLLNLQKHSGCFKTEGSKTAQRFANCLFVGRLRHSPPMLVLSTPQKVAANEMDLIGPNCTFTKKLADSLIEKTVKRRETRLPQNVYGKYL